MELKLGTCDVRSWRETDAHSVAVHANNRRVAIHLRDRFPHPYTPAHAHAFIAAALASDPETNFAILTGDLDGNATYPTSLSVAGGVSVPGVRFYQVRYRDAVGVCAPASWNSTNGVAVIWSP